MRKRKRVLRRLIAAVLLLTAGATVFLKLRLEPLVDELACTQVSNEASNIVADAVMEQVESGNVAYDRLIRFEKDESGAITALKTDMGEMNRLKTEILQHVSAGMLHFDRSELSIPLGNLVFSALFSGRGPRIPVEIVSIPNSDAEFESRFSDAGINQTLHQIVLHVSMTVAILTPAGTQELTVGSDMVVAETILIGRVPQAVLNGTG